MKIIFINYKKFHHLGILLCLSFLFSISTAKTQFRNDTTSNILQEKLFVHTDKTFYLPGEFIWFKIYDLDEVFHRPVDFSKLAYVEILDNQNKPVLQTKISLENSCGNGSFLIPTNIVSGNYILRAYTAWMKNFGVDVFFEQPITIVNTIQGSMVDTVKPSVKYDIQFLPEGGNMVAGLPCEVGFKLTNQWNEPIECKGILINQKKDTILHFTTLRFGAGHFNFIPQKDEIYYAITSQNDTTIITKLPEILAQGFSLHVQGVEENQLQASVQSNIQSADPNIYIQLHAHQQLKKELHGILSNNKAVFLIDKNELSEGITVITLFSANKTPLAERLYFKRPKQILHTQLTTDKKLYETREKVNVELKINDSIKRTEGNFSISVFKADDLQSASYQNILGYIYLSSELKGKIISPEYYFTSNGPDVEEITDNLMLTQGWRKFKNNESPTFRNHFPFYAPELEGPIITGKLTDKKTGHTAKNIMAYLSIPGKSFQFLNSLSDSSGNVLFNASKFYDKHSIVLQTNNLTDSIYRIDLDNPFSNQFSDNAIAPFVLSENQKDEIRNRHLAVQVENSFLSEEKHAYTPFIIIDSLPFYGYPDKKYFLDDYTRFASMEEVMREYISNVMVRHEQNSFRFRVFNAYSNNYFINNPLILLDGIPIFDVNKIVSFDPMKVQKIEVVSQKYFWNYSTNDGIISYSTYRGDLAGFEMDKNSVAVEYDGIQKKREFYSPVYENNDQKNSRFPDFRNVLYWKPEIKMFEPSRTKIDFYTSDMKGKYIIVVQGISKSGMAGFACMDFNVTER